MRKTGGFTTIAKVRWISVFCLASVTLVRGAGIGANVFLLEKQQLFDQLTAAGPVPTVLVEPFEFLSVVPVAAFLTLPAGNAISVSTGVVPDRLFQYFNSEAAMNAAFPNGAYILGNMGLGPYNLNLNADNYPVAPAVIGGTWQNGILVVDPAQDVTISFNSFANYGTGAGSYEEFGLSSQTGLDSVSLDQRNISIAGFAGISQSSTPFASYKIPAGTLTPGAFYSAFLNYSQIVTALPATPAISLYASNLQFYVACQSGAAVPAPVITTQPADQTGPVGSTLTFSIGAQSPGSSSLPGGILYVWYANGQPINTANTQKYTVVASATGGTLTIANVATTDAGAYAAKVVDAGGRVNSQAANLIIGPAPVGVITTQPQSLTVTNGTPVSFSVGASGIGPFLYQWYLNGVAILGATNATFTFNASAFRAGVYTVTVANSGGSVTSAGATLGVYAAPTITIQPSSQLVAIGSTVVLSLAATGTPAPTFQWFHNGVLIPGVSGPRYLINGATAANGGPYTSTVTNSQGTAQSVGINLNVVSTNNPGRLINLSILSTITGSLTMGFVNGGSGTSGSEPLLIRAVGPSLGAAPFNYPAILPDPTLQLVQQTGSINLATNAGWGTPASNVSLVQTAEAATGAFALTNPASLDSALVENLPSVGGGYSVVVAGKSADSGNAITEVYDATSAYTAASTRLINLSCITTIPAGGALGVGFVLGGAVNRTLLVRVSGPTLANFGTPGTMTDPQMVITPQSNGASIIAANSGWAGDAVISAVAANIGAFAFTSTTSHDSAVVLTLPPGIPYTVEVNSASGGGGAVLVEIYEVP